MSGIFEWLAEMVHQVTAALGYPGIFFLMVLENLFPPIPSEIVMPFAGFLAARGELHMAGVLIAGTLGSLVGALVIYFIGMKLGEDRLRRWICQRGKFLLLSDTDLDRALGTFDRHGKAGILIGRLIPGARSLISVPAGVRHMNMRSFLLLTVIGTIAWNTLLTVAGYLLGSNWQQVLEFLDHYERVLLFAAGGLLLLFLYRRLTNRPVNSGC